jgi:hypothetical protein
MIAPLIPGTPVKILSVEARETIMGSPLAVEVGETIVRRPLAIHVGETAVRQPLAIQICRAQTVHAGAAKVAGAETVHMLSAEVTSTNATHSHAANVTAAEAGTANASGASSAMPAASASAMPRSGDFSAEIDEGTKRNGRCEQFDKSARHDAYSYTNASSPGGARRAHLDCALKRARRPRDVIKNCLRRSAAQGGYQGTVSLG